MEHAECEKVISTEETVGNKGTAKGRGDTRLN